MASEQKEALIKEFPGLKRHFIELEEGIQTNPDAGNNEIMLSVAGHGTPVRTMGAERPKYLAVWHHIAKNLLLFIFVRMILHRDVLFSFCFKFPVLRAKIWMNPPAEPACAGFPQTAKTVTDTIFKPKNLPIYSRRDAEAQKIRTTTKNGVSHLLS
jgi:hypothetical protein